MQRTQVAALRLFTRVLDALVLVLTYLMVMRARILARFLHLIGQGGSAGDAATAVRPGACGGEHPEDFCECAWDVQ